MESGFLALLCAFLIGAFGVITYKLGKGNSENANLEKTAAAVKEASRIRNNLDSDTDFVDKLHDTFRR